MRVRAALVIVVALSGVLVSGCGGSGRLSPSDYRTRLSTIGKEAGRAQRDVEKGLSAKTVEELRRRLSAFAAASKRLGDEVAKLEPPKNAEAANAELARGERDLAGDVRAVDPQLAKLKSVKSALAFLGRHLRSTKGAREVDHALRQLRKLGYTRGS
jgi:hypothetical protein